MVALSLGGRRGRQKTSIPLLVAGDGIFTLTALVVVAPLLVARIVAGAETRRAAVLIASAVSLPGSENPVAS